MAFKKLKKGFWVFLFSLPFTLTIGLKLFVLLGLMAVQASFGFSKKSEFDRTLINKAHEQGQVNIEETKWSREFVTMGDFRSNYFTWFHARLYGRC